MTHAELAADLIEQLANEEWPLTLSPVFTDWPEEVIKDARAPVRCYLVPGGFNASILDQSGWRSEFELSLGVMAKLPPDSSDLTVYRNTMQALRDWLQRSYRPPPGVEITELSHTPPFLPHHFQDHRQFTSFLTFTLAVFA